MTTIYNCYWSEMKCDGCGDQHKDCEKWDAIVKQEEKERIEEQEAERKRMLCGKCDNCKVVGVKLNPHGIWDLCDGCSKKTATKKK